MYYDYPRLHLPFPLPGPWPNLIAHRCRFPRAPRSRPEINHQSIMLDGHITRLSWFKLEVKAAPLARPETRKSPMPPSSLHPIVLPRSITRAPRARALPLERCGVPAGRISNRVVKHLEGRAARSLRTARDSAPHAPR